LQLITVPSCDAHNHERGGHDDYFRTIITTGAADNPTAMDWIDKKVLKYLKLNKKELKKLLEGSYARVPVKSPGGIITGFKPAFTYDRPRMQKVVDAYVRGIWFHENGKRLPETVPVWDFDLNPNHKDYGPFPVSSNYQSYDKTFAYCITYLEGDRTFSMIVMMFYEKVVIVTGTGGEAEINTMAAAAQPTTPPAAAPALAPPSAPVPAAPPPSA
jgi:hypothetical protein